MLTTIFEGPFGNGIHVMNYQTRVDLVSFDAEIAAVIPENNSTTGLSPLSGAIKMLIKPSVESECGFTHESVK